MTQLHICISENRKEDEVGIKLLVLSLTRHEPGAILHLFVDDLGQGLKDWLTRFPNVSQEHLRIDKALGWNIKAKLFFKLFADGIDTIVWIDSDIIVTAPIGHYFDEPDPEVMITAEQYYTISNQGTACRTRGWGMTVGRDLPFTPNNCILRVTTRHMEFLAAWQTMLDRPYYKALQAGPWSARPFYMMGSQDAMSALMGSAGFAHIPVRPIRRGRDIAQCFMADGYSPTERLANLARLPPFVHAQGGKPWRLSASDQSYYHVSPFWYAARAYRHDLLPQERAWLDHRPQGAMVLHYLSLGHPSLAGFWPALTALVKKRCAAVVRLIKRKISGR